MGVTCKVPELRFGEFSGEWESVKLERLGSFQGGGTPRTTEKEYWIGKIPWISSSDINDDDIKNINVTRYINETAIKESATKLIPKGSVLFVSRVGVGKLAIANVDLCTSQDFTNLTLKNVNSQYIAYYFLANKTLLIRYSQGTSIKGFTTNDIKTLKLNLPSKPEQEKIASFLSAVDNRIEQLTKKEQLLREYKKGVMQKIFSQELRFKDDDGSEFPEWVEMRLGEISKITTGSSNREDSSLDGKYTFFDRSEDIRTSGIFLFDGEAVIVAGEGQQFIPKYFVGKFDLHQRTYAIMNFNGAVGKFIYYFIFKSQNYFLSQAVGSTVKSLRLPMFENMPINLPCTKEQTKIANFLSSLDTKIEQVSKELKLTKEFKKALLQQMFV